MTSSLLLQLFALFCLQTHIDASTQYLTYSTNEIWSKSGSTYRRPQWAGNVTIIYDESQIWHVHGVIVPCSTTGRPGAPNPYNGFETGTDLSLDKGHLLALSNGGPDIKRNIVPQGSYWQEHGGWRQLEEAIFDHAMAKYGWDPKAIYHASAVGDVADPGHWNYVTFNLSMFDYNTATGEPMKYTGTLRSGHELYSFTISPDLDAVWAEGLAPPSEATFVAETTTSTTTYKDRDIAIKMETTALMEGQGVKDSILEDETGSINVFGIVFFAIIVVVILFVAAATLCLYCRSKQKQKEVMNPAQFTPYHRF